MPYVKERYLDGEIKLLRRTGNALDPSIASQSSLVFVTAMTNPTR